jgi:hypothetical protein
MQNWGKRACKKQPEGPNRSRFSRKAIQFHDFSPVRPGPESFSWSTGMRQQFRVGSLPDCEDAVFPDIGSFDHPPVNDSRLMARRIILQRWGFEGADGSVSCGMWSSSSTLVELSQNITQLVMGMNFKGCSAGFAGSTLDPKMM